MNKTKAKKRYNVHHCYDMIIKSDKKMDDEIHRRTLHLTQSLLYMSRRTV